MKVYVVNHTKMKYNKRIITVTCMFLWHCVLAGAQVITGVICDKDTKLPVSNVSVFLDGTSINTITNNLGKFELKTASIINTKLVLQHLSYETAVIDRPFAGLPDTLYIEERINILSEVSVVADRFTRAQKMKAFREQFLGLSRAGRSCTIMNEDDIQIFYNMQTGRLTATSDKPIEVVNSYLGYKVDFTLMDFWVQYGSIVIGSVLNSGNAQTAFFAVVSSFSDMAPDNRRINQRRNNVYERSSNYFFKSFAYDALNENNFRIFNAPLEVDHRQYFATKDTLSQKMIHIIPGTDINKGIVFNNIFDSGSELSGRISVLYRRDVRSEIFFMTDSFGVDRYGNIDRIDSVWFDGQMGANRAGDMLPIDYEPTSAR